MPTYYLDASAVIKRYVLEVGSAWVQTLCSNEENTLIMAEITLAEVASAFARAARDGRISAEERLDYLDLFIGDCAEQYRLVAVERKIIDHAVDLTQSHYLRGYDAVQLATALAANAELLRKQLPSLTLVSADEDLLEAAKAKGLPTPDLPKGYQISQYDLPLSRDGWLEIEVDGQTRRIGIERVHLEEDTAKLVHVDDHSLIDFNRAGVPLMEIVSRPDIRTPEEARQYLTKLRTILRYLGVNSGNMEEGAMRCEANISVRPKGATEFGTKVEVKNLNSFHSVKLALEYEIERQTRILEAGGHIEQVTMGWDEARGVTVVQRTKEYAHDYRYFPEPDLPPLVLSREWVEGVRARLPELPDAKRARFMEQYGLSRYDASVLTVERPVADYFEACVSAM